MGGLSLVAVLAVYAPVSTGLILDFLLEQLTLVADFLTERPRRNKQIVFSRKRGATRPRVAAGRAGVLRG